MSLLIENVPMPEERSYRELVEAFRSMAVGQSVVFTGSHSYIHALAASNGISIKTRMVDGSNIPMRGMARLRIWRTG